MLYAKHMSGQTHTGLVTKPGGEVEVNDAVKFNILDLHMVKHWAIRFATDAACTVLRVDQVNPYQFFSIDCLIMVYQFFHLLLA